jgi:hypothetical protein
LSIAGIENDQLLAIFRLDRRRGELKSHIDRCLGLQNTLGRNTSQDFRMKLNLAFSRQL